MKKVFITGISGFVGSHLADYLVDQNTFEISGTYLSTRSLSNLSLVKDKISLHQLDLLDMEKTADLINNIKPDYIYHLAALPGVGDSYVRPLETVKNNVGAEVSVLEAVKNAKLTPRILVVTSADMYGKVKPEDIPIDEDTPFNPTNTYAVSKIAQDFLALQYFNSYNLSIIRARPFNHIGPRQTEGFVVADFAKRIVDIEKGNSEPVLKVGNINTRRDFTDVRDIVKAYGLLIEKGTLGDVYNIGRGQSYKISDILDMLIKNSKTKIDIETERDLLRAEDAPERICDTTKFVTLTGWKPTISIEQTLKDTLDYWRNIV